MKKKNLSLNVGSYELKYGLVAAMLLLNSFFAVAQSLNDKIDYGINNSSLDEGLRRLEKQSGFRVSFAVQLVDKYKDITIEKKIRTVKQTINQLLDNTDLRYQINGTNILIMKARYIHGKVTDDKNKPIAFANVVLLDKQNSSFIQGVISKPDGTFSIICHNDDDCILKCSFVGYETVFLNNISDNVGDVILHDDAIILKEVVVASERPTYKLTNEGLSVDIKNSLLSKAGTADDVLSQLPGVGGKDGKFIVFGKGVPQIYLNGRLLHDNSELGRLRSQDLKEIVIVRNPGAQYDAEVNSVILVRTIKKQIDNWSISFKHQIEQAHYFSFLDQLSWNYRKKGLDIFGTLYAENAHSWQKENYDRTIYTSNVWNVHSKEPVNSRNHEYNMTTGINEQINDSNSLGIEYNVILLPYSKTDIYYSSDISSGPEGDGHIDGVNHLSRPGRPSHTVSTYYNGKIGKLGVDFNGDYLYKRDSRDQSVEETSSAFGNKLVTTNEKTWSRLWASKLVLTYPLIGGTVIGGYEYTNTQRSNDFTNHQNFLNAVSDEVKEKNLAGFLSYQCELWKVSAQAGLRYEHVVSDYYNNDIKSKEQSRTYNNFFPNFSLSYKFGKVQTQLSYSMKTRRPVYYQLTSNYQYDDRFYYQQGDPMLRPTNWLDLGLQVSYSWVNFSASYVNYKHVIFTVDKLYEKDQNIIVETYKNIDKFRSCYAMLTLSPKIRFWNPVYSFWFTKQFYNASQVGLQSNFEKPRFYCQLRNTFQLHNNFIAMLNYIIYGQGNDGSIYFKTQQEMDCSLSKSFFKDRLTLNLQAFDIFKTLNRKYNLYTEHLCYNIDTYSDTQSIRLTVSYKFNIVPSKYKGTGAGNDEKKRL